ncbi:hypothetical protein PIB30_054511 [Stylosanthes scabra]|uniref:Uncharacterized protein n=1 Tax=Stylosanthes scabra TaxID=79078 RepID=A0ABU6UIA0_9FABA|nr:hypothetical protein [Stylosanthes scabra]
MVEFTWCAAALSGPRSPNLESVTEMQPSLKIRSTRLGSFSLVSRNRGLSLVEKISGLVAVDVENRAQENRLKQQWIKECPGPYTAGRGVALMASKLTPFLPSVALKYRQLRSFAHFTP